MFRYGRLVKGSAAGFVLAVSTWLAPVLASAQVPVSSCEDTWDYEGKCELDFAGFPVEIEGSWAIDPVWLAERRANFPGLPDPVTDIHVEILLRVGSEVAEAWTVRLPTGWECAQPPQPAGAACSATFSYGIDLDVPVAPPGAVKLECLAHRHSAPSLPGFGALRCSTGTGVAE